MIIVDGHLDLGFNYLGVGRDPRDSALLIREREGDLAKQPFRGQCMVGLPEMQRGGVRIVFPTLFLARKRDNLPVDRPASVTYETAEEAERCGRMQLEFYQRLADDEKNPFRMIGTRADLESVLAAEEPPIGFVPLMEGADPIVVPEDAPVWFERGIRIVGLAWRSTRYSGGTSEPGPLTEAGRALVPALDRAGIILDLSHAAEESFFEALDLYERPPIASHSNPRKICPGDRQLSDEMIRRIAARGGVIGSVPFNWMLQEGWKESGCPAVPLSRVAEAIHHVTQVAGTHHAAAIGSDLDGGFGAESAPEGLDTIADLPRLAEVLADVSFTDEQIFDILGRNWIRFLKENLPAGR
ncbi:MAG: peptidase [Gemmatimonadota bacterium]|nr:MAG: peptidase [Gemmatimonadota bacterium]